MAGKAKTEKAEKIKSNPVTRFGRSERKQLSNTGRQQAGLKLKKK